MQNYVSSFPVTKTKSGLTVNNGTIATVTTDDVLSGGTAIYINGGKVYARSSGNDTMDSDGIFTITGGIVVAVGARSTEAGMDVDARTLKLTGGIIIAAGGATSGPAASVSTMHSVIAGSGSAKKIVHIEATDGTEALTFLAPASYTTLLFASSKLKANTTYTFYSGGSVSNGTDFHGLHTSGTYTGGTISSG